jgi:hypothetical protein
VSKQGYIELSVATRAVEIAAAELLGRVILAFSRLDMALGLCIVWTDGGRNIESLSNEVPDWTFHKRLDYLTGLLLSSRACDDARRIAYDAWIADAHALRMRRNEMVYGR